MDRGHFAVEFRTRRGRLVAVVFDVFGHFEDPLYDAFVVEV
jgi:hypothetical protein